MLPPVADDAGWDGRLGAAVHDGRTTFAVWSGGAETVELCLLEAPHRTAAERRVPMRRIRGGAWVATVEDAPPGTAYGFRAAGPWDPAHGLRYDPRALLVDPYAEAVHGDEEPVSVVADRRFDWGGDEPPRVPWKDTVVYEAHVRTLTWRHPYVPLEHRGTYAALGHPAVVDHLHRVGVTAVELLPVHAFVSEPFLRRAGRRNLWGYNTLAFLAPHAGYAADPAPGAAVPELKSAIRALHGAGIEVLLDVVYNHTAEGGEDGPTLSLKGLDNLGYYRLSAGGGYVDVTGCGNTLDLRHPAALALVMDSLRHWVREFHVDGFRFDLATALARGSADFDPRSAFLAAVEQDPLLRRVKLVAEPWDLGPGGYRLGGFPPRWAEWNDRYRDDVRDFWLADNRRQRASGPRGIGYRLSGSSDLFGHERGPLASVNFVAAHDGFPLADLTAYERKHNTANGEDNRDGADENRSWNAGAEGDTDDAHVLTTRRRLLRALLATVAMSAGVPMLTAGDEMGRTQRGNNNGYSLPVDDAAVPWPGTEGWQPWQDDLLEWTATLLALRRTHGVVRRGTFFDGTQELAWFAADGSAMTAPRWFDHTVRTVSALLLPPASGAGSEQPGLLVVLHAGPDDVDVVLPALPAPEGGTASYRVVADTGDDAPEAAADARKPGERLRVRARTVVVVEVRAADA